MESFTFETFEIESEPFTRADAYSVVSVDYVEEADLRRLAQSSLGETLAWQPGVSSGYFGPGASRPVIRGVEGFRVRMLQDGVGTLDISESSPDHGVALDPLMVREVDIYRGPSALLYGNAAIGGAVNAITRVIPDRLPEETLGGSVESRVESVGDGKTLAAFSEMAVGEVAFTLAGSARDSDDYAIPGAARSAAYESTFDPEVNDPLQGVSVPVENPVGTLPNTFHESDNWSVGLGWIPEGMPLQIAGAYSRFDSNYGVPYQFSGDPQDLFGFSSLRIRHERFDTDLRVEPALDWASAIRFRLAYADYGHVELFEGRAKDSDKVFEDALFDQHALEARLEWYHALTDWLDGIVGLHFQKQDLTASFLNAPPLESSRYARTFETDNIGFFTLQTISLGELSVQGGFRYENQTIRDTTSEAFGYVLEDDYGSYSVASSLTWRREKVGPLDEIALTAAISRVERIPTVTERYAFWPNPAINRFLQGGDYDGEPLHDESSFGFELGVEAVIEAWSGRFNVYRYNYDNFIFLQDKTGQGNRAVYEETDASIYGFEGELRWSERMEASGLRLTAKLMSDYVVGENESDDQPLPRIPPLRAGGRIELSWRTLDAGLEYRYAFAQDRIQKGGGEVLPEFRTNAYSELNFDVGYSMRVRDSEITAFLRASNLLDEERRVHSSFIKSVAPLPGRNVSLGIRLSL